MENYNIFFLSPQVVICRVCQMSGWLIWRRGYAMMTARFPVGARRRERFHRPPPPSRTVCRPSRRKEVANRFYLWYGNGYRTTGKVSFHAGGKEKTSGRRRGTASEQGQAGFRPPDLWPHGNYHSPAGGAVSAAVFRLLAAERLAGLRRLPSDWSGRHADDCE